MFMPFLMDFLLNPPSGKASELETVSGYTVTRYTYQA